jgi:hypothetical protein
MQDPVKKMLLFAGIAAVFASLLATTQAQSSLSWARMNVTTPPARGYAAMAYDEAGKTLVLFGGVSDTGYFNDTWIFNGTTWTQLSTVSAPTPRASAELVYDYPTHKLVLFGGYNGTYLGDTLIFDGQTQQWTQAAPSRSPIPSSGVVGFADPLSGRAELFGGYDGNLYQDQMWQWRGTTWTRLWPATLPGGRAYAPTANTPKKNVVLSNGLGDIVTSNTWLWDGMNWTQQFPATQPIALCCTSAAYDFKLGRVIVFGGFSSQDENVTWVWSGSDWIQISPVTSPSPREGEALATDRATRTVYMFGGRDATTYLGDMWKFIP